MTKEVKNIIIRDIKKYRQLVEHTEGETQEVFIKILNYLKRICEE